MVLCTALWGFQQVAIKAAQLAISSPVLLLGSMLLDEKGIVQITPLASASA